MCFTCFCVFSSVYREYHSCILCVFVFFLCFFPKYISGHNPCVLRVFVFFYYDYLGEVFKPQQGQTPNVFYVSLCFFLSLTGISFMYFTCFCVFYYDYTREVSKATAHTHTTPLMYFMFLCFFVKNIRSQPVCWIDQIKNFKMREYKDGNPP